MNTLSGNQASTEEIAMVLASPMLMQSNHDHANCQPSAEAVSEEETNFLTATMNDEVTTQVVASGALGIASTAAILSPNKRKPPYTFETNPMTRKRQRNRLLKKLRQTIDEFATCVGQQAIILVVTPDEPNISYKVYGAKPLTEVIKNHRGRIMEELQTALAYQAPPPVQDKPALFDLPSFVFNGVVTPVEKMNQGQLRTFIPLMLKYSTGRGKPGWGQESTKPPWWPWGVPWANVRIDVRSENEKQIISWTDAMRQIVINCYKFHGREDLLPAFNEKANIVATASTTQFAPMVLHPIYTMDTNPVANPDENVSIVPVDPNDPIITLPDGTAAHVQGMITTQTAQGDGTPVNTIQSISDDGEPGETFDVNSVIQATLNPRGQLIFSGKDRHGNPISVSGVMPMTANIPHVHANSSDDTVCSTPVGAAPRMEPNIMETIHAGTPSTISITIPIHSMIQGDDNEEPQVVPMFSSQDVIELTKAIQGIGDDEVLHK